MTVELEFTTPYGLIGGQWVVDLATAIEANTAVQDTTAIQREHTGNTLIIRLIERDTLSSGDETTIVNRVQDQLTDAIHIETRENV